MKIKIILTIFSIISLVACSSNKYNKPQLEANENVQKEVISNEHKVVVEEVLQTDSYTYLKVSENKNEFWLAVNKSEIKKGSIYYFSKDELKMENFKSKDLQKTFNEIYFVQNLSTQPLSDNATSHISSTPVKPALDKKDITIDVINDGITIAELYKNKDKYNGKIVKIAGQVVKFNEAIMDRNWIHLQDGTEFNKDFDLTITSAENVKVGDKVIFQGVISLNKDFGAGYKYAVIMENATIINESHM